MRFCGEHDVRDVFHGNRVAIVGSGPGCLGNEPGFIDGHDVVVRANNYKLSDQTGFRCDVHYSFFGSSIKKSARDLQRDGVKLLMCKCPDGKFMDSPWHERNNKPNGVDFRYVYKDRKDWWFGDVFVPTMEEFMEGFELLGGHIPSTGFAAILAVLKREPGSLHLTGFDFFSSKIHNVNEPWRAGRSDDPIGHAPSRERAWLADNMDRVSMDARLTEIMKG